MAWANSMVVSVDLLSTTTSSVAHWQRRRHSTMFRRSFFTGTRIDTGTLRGGAHWPGGISKGCS